MATDVKTAMDRSEVEAGLVLGQPTFGSVTDQISSIALERPTGRGWLAGFALSFALVMLLLWATGYLLVAGIGIWGVNVPVGWGFAIINFVWWIGIGHAGTLISAVLFLMHQQWRNSINRFAEAMTLFALACAGLFPLLHLGRPGLFYWLFPYPSTSGVWPQYRSPLVWDVFAITTYLIVSLLFWYIGLVPDLATLRDRARSRLAGTVYAVLAMGWRGDAEHWHRYETAYRLLAGLATPLVVSVHTIVAYDFAVSVLPGWHTTILPPYFVAGAMFSGFAMVLVLGVPIRHFYRLDNLITIRHLQNLAKLLLATSLMVGYGYLMENFVAWYSGGEFERHHAMVRLFGRYAAAYWSLLACNIAVPQLLWSRRLRSSPIFLWCVGLVVLIGMWLERYVIVITSLHQDYLPSGWGTYQATLWDWSTFVGTIGLFLAMLFLFLRFLPMVSIYEVRQLLPQARRTEQGVAGEPAQR